MHVTPQYRYAVIYIKKQKAYSNYIYTFNLYIYIYTYINFNLFPLKILDISSLIDFPFSLAGINLV